MRKIIIFLSLILILAAATFSALMQFVVPAHVEGKAIVYLQRFGFTPQSLPPPIIKFGSIEYNNITLDEHKLSTIKTIRLSYDPLNALLLNKINRFNIIGAHIIGEWDSVDGLEISNWSMPASVSALQKIDAHAISIQDAQISILTEEFAGLNLSYNMYARRKGDNYHYQDRIQSTQKALSFFASSSGIIAKDFWNTQIEFSRARISIPAIKSRIMRASGHLTLTQDISSSLSAQGQLRAGGLRIEETPWHNVKIILDKKGGSPWLAYVDANSLENNDVALSISASLWDNYITEIYANNTEDEPLQNEASDFKDLPAMLRKALETYTPK